MEEQGEEQRRDKKKGLLFGKGKPNAKATSAGSAPEEDTGVKPISAAGPKVLRQLTKEEREQRIEKGQLFCRVIIEVLGKPKEHVESTIRDFVKMMKESDRLFTVTKEEFSDAIPAEQTMFSTFVELEMWMHNINALIGFCYDYMPASIEIFEPEAIHFSNAFLSSVINEMQGRMHQLDMIVKTSRQEAAIVNQNFKYLLGNAVMIALTRQDLSLEKLSRLTGVPAEDLGKLLDDMIKSEPRIRKEGELYHLDLSAQQANKDEVKAKDGTEETS